MLTTVDLIDTAEAARRVGVNRSTLTRWVSAERIKPALVVPGYRGNFLFHPEDVEALRLERAA